MPAEINLLPADSIRAVEALAEVFEARSIRYALIGGLAVLLRGRPRYTRDVDFLIEVPQLQLPGLLDDLIARGFVIDPAVAIREFIREHVTAFPFGRIRVDWLKPVLPIYANALAGATDLEWTRGRPVRVAGVEGLIATKLLAFRSQDLVDIETLFTANRDDVDIALIRSEWSPFAPSEPDRTAWLEASIDRLVIRRE